MKKDIMNLVNSESGQFRINNISTLKRWTTDGLGNKSDKLKLEFDTINNVRFSACFDTFIKSRDYDGIVAECESLTKKFTEEISYVICNNLRVGYINTSRR